MILDKKFFRPRSFVVDCWISVKSMFRKDAAPIFFPAGQTQIPQFNELSSSCLGCQACVIECPDDALTMIDQDLCLYLKECSHCGICLEVCPEQILIPGLSFKQSKKKKSLIFEKLFSGALRC